jgi:hypothetical protein
MLSKDQKKMLDNLPYNLKKEPSFDNLKVWILKHLKIAKIFKIISILGFLISLIWLFIFKDYDFLLATLMFIGIFFIFNKRQKTLTLSDEQVKEYLKINNV